MVGLKIARSAQDEKLIDSIFHTHLAPETSYSPVTPLYGATATNLIIDARPTKNAMANVVQGAGTENMENYRGAKKAYLGIDNIHVMRGSLNRVVEALEPVDRAALRRSGWLKHISTLLDGALIIVKNIHINSSHVLIHCSDGWDRTAQLAGLAEICLDPYYRTFDGFRVLVEKDWLSFGHKFLDRCGHLSSDKFFTVTDEDEEEDGGAQRAAQAFFASVQKQFASNAHVKETSPVFHQFLDCVRQIQRQFPDRFEFNQSYLSSLHYHLYSCQYGTFLFNNERERRQFADRTHSIWGNLKGDFTNASYDPGLDTGDDKVLLPNAKDVRFWHELFKKGDEEMNALAVRQGDARGVDVLGPVSDAAEDPLIAGPAKQTLAYEPRRGRHLAATAAEGTAPLPTAVQSGKAWGWGALTALQGAARDLKDFSVDALQTVRDANERAGPRVGTGDGELVSKQSLPCERNPWGDDEAAVAVAPAAEVTAWPSERLSTNAASLPDPYVNEWASAPATGRPPSARTVSTSLADLTLESAIPPAVSKGELNGATAQEDKEIFDAAMGRSTKQWDPLGVL